MLSIIIITRNEEECLPRLLESIKRQSFRDFEVILSDAQSTDRTREIALFYGCKIVEGGLPSVGRNNGARFAKGEILLFLDADVVLPKGFLEKSLLEFSQKKVGCASPILLIMSDHFVDKFLFLFYNTWIRLTSKHFPQALGNCIYCWKNAFNGVMGFDESILFAEDADFIKRCGFKYRFRVLNKTKFYSNSRRIKKEGRIGFIYKTLIGAFYRVFVGEIRKPIFNYELNGGVNIKTQIIK
ncbi:MAG: glycosyltransferase [Nanoarchaeota archaeon]